MHTATSIVIHAPREKIYDTVRDLSRWPELLPHYRYVTTLSRRGSREMVKMACVRSGLPIAWYSEYEADPQSLELRFQHLRAWTKGMKVVWRLTPRAEGTLVEIVHDLHFRIWGLGWLVEPIIGGFFIEHVAQQTLQTFKTLIEAAEQPNSPAQPVS